MHRTVVHGKEPGRVAVGPASTMNCGPSPRHQPPSPPSPSPRHCRKAVELQVRASSAAASLLPLERASFIDFPESDGEQHVEGLSSSGSAASNGREAELWTCSTRDPPRRPPSSPGSACTMRSLPFAPCGPASSAPPAQGAVPLRVERPAARREGAARLPGAIAPAGSAPPASPRPRGDLVAVARLHARS